MSMKFLLDHLTPQAITHINSTINTNNQESYRKLKKIFNDQFIELKSFEDTNLDITSFDWGGIERDRNWWWQAHALPFLNWYLDSYDLQSEEERKKYFTLCISAIDNWHTKTKKYDSPLAWHDHGTAFRSRNIVNWIIFCHLKDVDVITASESINLYSLIIVHLEWLLDSNNYSKYTNHGFDQAMILLTIGIMFDTEGLEPQRTISRERLEEEIKYAFTDEGVHIENSPGYQKFMLARLKQLRLLRPLGETVVSKLAESYIVKAESFLRAITLPNGYLPMIGDTRGGDKGLRYNQISDIDIIDYSDSGYVILRGETLKGKDIHIIFKCSHLSNYHRHDDDLSIHIYYDNQTVLGDGGLGNHNEKDIRRKILRSNAAHNVPYICDIDPVRSTDLLNNNKSPKVYLDSIAGKIVGKSFGYGNLIKREIDFSKLAEGLLYISDHLINSKGKCLATHYFSPLEIVEGSKNLIITDNDRVFVKIKPLNNILFNNIESYYSYDYNMFETKSSYSFCPVNGADNVYTEIHLDHAPETIYKMSYRGYGPIEVKSVGGWLYDQSYPNNVCHHIMSLRWLTNVDSESLIKRIIHSFISYNNSKNTIKSKYYLGREADHTTSIRINILLQFYKKFNSDISIYRLIEKELFKNINSCLKDTYKENNNHGLMVDKALLSCFFEEQSLLQKYEVEISFVFYRLMKQINAIFDDNGFCKEHSISYQEYNLGIMIDLLEVISKGYGLGFDNALTEIEERIVVIKKASKKALGYVLKDNDEYITVGDTFESPKPKIMSQSFGNYNLRKALYPYADKQGFFYNKTLGITVFRNKKLHFLMNASWHSYVHKQNDDLSIFLRVNGEDVFVDGGYSDIISRDEIDTRSEYLHSTIIPNGCSWISRGSVNLGFSQLNNPTVNTSYDSIVFGGAHSRVEGLIINRNIMINENEKYIKIMDTVSEKVTCLHRFLVPSYHEIIVSDLSVIIKTVKGNIKIESYLNKDYVIKQGIDCTKSLVKGVKSNQSRELIALDFLSQGQCCLLISYD